MTLTRLTPLDGEGILPLADVKAAARILNTAEDLLLAGFRDAAVGHVERVSGVALAEAQFVWALPRFAGRVELPMQPVVSVDGVSYLDGDGETQAYVGARLIDGSVYPAAGGSWPAALDGVTVTFTAGLSSPASAPELVVAAQIRFQILNDRGGSDSRVLDGLERAFDAMIQSYRRVLV